MSNPCPHFSVCSGCSLDETIFLPPIWEKALLFFKQIAPHLSPTLTSQGFEKSRSKAKLAVRTGPSIGLYKKGTHEVVSIPSCQVHHPSINRAVSFLKEEIAQSPLSPYRENPPSGLLRYLQLFTDLKTGLIQLSLIVNAEGPEPILEDFCQSLQKSDLWHSIWLNFHPTFNNRILGNQWQLIYGEPFLWQTLQQTPIAFHPGAFSQSHLSLYEKILQKIDSWVSKEKIVELYAGVGSIALSLRKKALQLHLIENNPFAYLSFQKSVELIPDAAHISYECGDVYLPRSKSKFLTERGIKNGDLFPYDLVIADPPRKGLEASLLKQLCSLKKSRLIYLSCGFESFQRDSETMSAHGWTFQEAQGYLLFPGTDHVEILALLEKGH